MMNGYRGSGLDDPVIAHLQELQRFAEIGRMSASLLHEMSSPLTAAMLHLDPGFAGSSPSVRSARHNVQILQRYVQAARQQVQQSSKPRWFSVRSQLEQVRRILEPHAHRQNVELSFTITTTQKLYGDAVKFQQIVSNLVKNAIDSYATITKPSVHRVRVVIASNEALEITVQDFGLGMVADELEQIFEPFYTTKVRAGHGLGIGLTIVKQFVEADFGGSITAQSQYGHGTTFTVTLPLSSSVDQLL